MKRFVLTLCLLVMFGTAVFAASEPVEKPETDARLDQKLTIKAVGRPLGDFLKEVTAQTGVKMTARKDAADIKVAVFVNDTPLSQLRDALKKGLHLQCTREGKQNEWTYAFWEDLKTKQEAERVRQEDVKKLHVYLDKLCKQLTDMEAAGDDPLALAKKLEAMTPEQIDKLLNENPRELERLTAFPHSYDLPIITVYSSLAPLQIQAVWAGQQVTVRTDEMSSDLRDKFGARSQKWQDEEERAYADGRSTLPDKIESVTLSIGDSGASNNPALNFFFNFVPPENPGEGSSYVLSSGSTMETPDGEEMDEQADASWFEGTPEERAARNTLKLKVKDDTSPYEVMEQVFDRTGVSIVADYYTRLTRDFTMWKLIQGYHRPFKIADDVLETVSKEIKAEFAKIDDVRLMSSKSWPSDRQREIPERLLVRWRAARKQYGGLRIQEAIEMADLNKMQLDDFRLYKIGSGWAVRSCQSALKLARSLTADQWQEAVSDQGIPISKLSGDQFALALAWTQAQGDERHPGDTSNPFENADELRAGRFKIVRDPYGEKPDEIKGRWVFTLEPQIAPQAVAQAAKEAADKGELVFRAPYRDLTAMISLAELNTVTKPKSEGDTSPPPTEQTDTGQSTSSQ